MARRVKSKLDNLPLGSLLKHRGGMYAYIKEKTHDGYKVYYAGGINTWVEITPDKFHEWEILRVGN